MNIVFVTALHSMTPLRLALAEECLRHARWLGCEIVCAATLDEDVALCERLSVPCAVVDNQGLGAKWNAAFALAREQGTDAVMIVGSDDFVSRPYLTAMLRLAERRDMDHATTTDVWFYDLLTGRAIMKACERVGAGRLVSRRAMDAVAWAPHTPEREKGMDADIDAALDAAGITHHRVGPAGPVLDVKCDYGLWSFDHFVRSSRKVPLRHLLSYFPLRLQRFLLAHGATADMPGGGPRPYYEASTLGEMRSSLDDLLRHLPPDTPVGFVEDGFLTFLGLRMGSVDENCKLTEDGADAVVAY